MRTHDLIPVALQSDPGRRPGETASLAGQSHARSHRNSEVHNFPSPVERTPRARSSPAGAGLWKRCPTDLDGFRLISLSPARSADRAWRPVDSVRVAEVIIRTYERRDAVGVADVFYRSVREVALSDYTPEQVGAWVPGRWDAEREHRRSGDGRLVLVAADEPGRVVAFIDLEPDGHIDRLFCAPEAAGRGVASRLYDAIETAARTQGIQRLFTEASEPARRFFERKGFTVLERQDMILRGVPIHNYRMAKTLG